ncbi:nucleoside monophosphate kinase [Streptomyces sp. NPDC096205]|uniref:nucleoside monophosphate kinase n=1 Tax=Streptomyces sp. NPDC096205 TaxID=3366081 RepID=UPI0037FC8FD2
MPQARELTTVLAATGAALDAVLELTAPEDVVVERLLSRGRPDDTEDVVRHRQRVYESQTAPLLAHYAGILVTVPAVGPVEDITARALAGLAEAGAA